MNIYSNIVDKEKTNQYIELVLKTLKDSLSKSLGPYGSTTIMQGSQLDDCMTKDGYTILKGIKFNDPIAITFLNIIKDASAELVKKVGDGSTSTIVASYYFYEALKTLTDTLDHRPKYVMDTINNCVDKLINVLEKNKKVITDDLNPIKYIAAVSLNNNLEVGSLLKEVYEKIGTEGFIKVKLGNSSNTYYNKTEGFQIDTGYLDKIFINSENAECVLDSPAVLMFDGFVDEDEHVELIRSLVELVSSSNNSSKFRSLIVIAPGFGDKCKKQIEALNNFYKQNNYKKNYCVLQHRLSTEMGKEVLYDLSLMTGGDIIKNTMGIKLDLEQADKYLGYASNVVINAKTSTFYGATEKDSKVLEAAKSDIRKELQTMKDENIVDYARSYELNKRLAVLNQNLVTIYVGGNSEQERHTNKDLVDDAVAACKSALQYGYNIGCNLAIVTAINEIFENDSINGLQYNIFTAIRDAFKNVYKEVLIKSTYSDEQIEEIIEKSISNKEVFDLTTNEYTNDKVINSVNTEIEIIKNVVSIISLILTSNQFVAFNPNFVAGEINE